MGQGLQNDTGLNKKRSVILSTTIIFGFIAIFLRLTDLMIFNHKLFAEKAKMQQVKSEDIQVMRGNIFDRRGREFAINVELESLYCDAKEVSIDKERVNRLSSALNMEPRAIQAKFDQEKRFTWINRKLSQERVQKVRDALSADSRPGTPSVRGFGFISEPKRVYPRGELAAHIIGNVGLDNQPLEGIELAYDKYLRIAGGKVSFSRDASGKVLSSGVNMEAKGNNVLLTIDESLQYIAEKELEKAMARWRAVAATAIVMDPATGEILALANRPTYDLNEIGKAGKNDVRNRAITDIYEPGSTYKIIVGTAALEEKLFRLDSTFDCGRGSIEVGGKVIHDAHRHGLLTFKEVIQKSSNVGSIMIGMKLGKENVYKYSKLFGYGDRTGIDLPGEVSGWIRKPEKWSATSIGAIPIGQEVAVTPLQVLRAYAAIANGGYLVTPHVVQEIRTHDGLPVFSFTDKDKKRIISEQTATIFKDILKTVVEEGGTATGAAVDGNQVAGKTGTAQLIDRRTKRYSKDRFVSSFVGFVPADNPRLAMIVVVYEPRGAIYGGVVAGPIFKSIADQSLSYLNVPRDDSREKNILMVAK
ncbi:MAG: penicillin-binding protein 2 [Nitrospirae bacterium]|nr:MAG: penicillin-binding protein 2 [Nitrospirota bacterium]